MLRNYKSRAIAIEQSVPLDFDPGAVLRAFQDGVAENEFVVAGLEGGKLARRGELSGVDVLVKIAEELIEGVGITFGVAAGIGSVAARAGAHQRRIFDEFLVEFVAAS